LGGGGRQIATQEIQGRGGGVNFPCGLRRQGPNETPNISKGPGGIGWFKIVPTSVGEEEKLGRLKERKSASNFLKVALVKKGTTYKWRMHPGVHPRSLHVG